MHNNCARWNLRRIVFKNGSHVRGDFSPVEYSLIPGNKVGSLCEAPDIGNLKYFCNSFPKFWAHVIRQFKIV